QRRRDARGIFRRQPRQSWQQWQCDNLAQLLAQFAPAQRKLPLDSLAANYPEAVADARLERAIARAWRRRKARFLRKCFRSSSAFCARRDWRRAAVWKRDFDSDDLADFIQNPDAWMARGALLKDGHSATVVRARLGGRAVVIKRNNIRNPLHWLRHCLRTPRCRRNWRNAHLLHLCGLITPAPIAAMEERWGPLRFRGYYLCAFDDSPSAAHKYATACPSAAERARFAELFEGMRLARICHGDFKASNLLVTERGIALLDLDSMKEAPTLADMDEFARKDRRRFLKNWRDQPEQMEAFVGVFESGCGVNSVE
ncbi:MAG: lipopolysaccharide kinase InaA family protein, partial [bacterium]